MRNNFLYLFLILFSFSKTTAQTLIPYLGANGKYGYADESGKVLIQPAFDHLGILWPEKFLGIQVQKDNNPMFLLRNGMTVEGSYYAARPVLNYTENNRGKPDTMPNMIVVQSNKKVVFANLNTRKTLAININESLELPRWFPLRVKDYYSEHGKFYNGMCRVIRENGSVNFVDTNFNEVLPRDYPVGAFAGDSYFLLGNEKQKVGIADRNGKVTAPFVWTDIKPAGKDGYFLVNNEYKTKTSNLPDRAGVIKADGSIFIDTMYNMILPVADKYLILQSREKAGMVDYQGNWVFPFEYREITQAYFTGKELYFNARSTTTGKCNILNIKGEKQLDQDHGEINPYINGYGKKPGYLLRDRPFLGIVDSNFQLLFTDTLMNIFNPFANMLHKELPTHFQVIEGQNNYANNRQGIRDQKGGVIIPGIYDVITVLPYVSDNLYLVKKDSLFGVFDTKGAVVFPLNFTDIQVENPGNRSLKDTIVWARAVGAKFYTAYDQTGKKLGLPDSFMPNSYSKNQLLQKVYNRQKDKSYMFLTDGSLIPLPDPRLTNRIQQIASPDGGFLVDASQERVQVLDALLNEIVPKGFVVPKKLWIDNLLLYTGLLPVFQLPAGFDEIPESPQVLEPTKNTDIVEEEKVMESPPVVDNGYRSRTLPVKFEACGVINAKGEWVVKPKKGVYFKPMSYYLVKEYGKDEDPTKYSRGHVEKILRVNQADAKAIEVARTRFEVFNHNNNFNMIFGLNVSGEGYGAYFNHKGEQLTDFNMISGGWYLQDRNLVTYRNKRGGVSNAIIDASGKTIVDLGDLEAERIYDYRSNWNVSHLVVHKRGSTQEGLIDSMGKLVLPLQYKDLKRLEHGHLLSCENEQGNTDLINIKGQLLYSAPKKCRFSSFQMHNNYILAFADDLTVVVSPQGDFVRAIPNNLARNNAANQADPMLFEFLIPVIKQKSNQIIWVNFVTGQEYREK